MYEILLTEDAFGRAWIVRNSKTGVYLKVHRFYDDAMAHLRRLEQARMRRLRDRNVRQFA